MNTADISALSLALVVSAAMGLVGAVALMKRTILAGDVMSHIALPGLGLAFLFGFHPLLGAAATLLVGIIGIWQLGRATGLTTEVSIGMIFAASVALGALLTPEEDLIEALFGGLAPPSPAEFIAGAAVSVFIFFAIWKLKDRYIIWLFSSELASSTRIRAHLLDLSYLFLFGLAILAGLKILGALLAGSLIIIPAAIARQLTHTLGKFFAVSVAASIVSTLAGFLASHAYAISAGPATVISASLLFCLSLFKKVA